MSTTVAVPLHRRNVLPGFEAEDIMMSSQLKSMILGPRTGEENIPSPYPCSMDQETIGQTAHSRPGPRPTWRPLKRRATNTCCDPPPVPHKSTCLRIYTEPEGLWHQLEAHEILSELHGANLSMTTDPNGWQVWVMVNSRKPNVGAVSFTGSPSTLVLGLSREIWVRKDYVRFYNCCMIHFNQHLDEDSRRAPSS